MKKKILAVAIVATAMCSGICLNVSSNDTKLLLGFHETEALANYEWVCTGDSGFTGVCEDLVAGSGNIPGRKCVEATSEQTKDCTGSESKEVD